MRSRAALLVLAIATLGSFEAFAYRGDGLFVDKGSNTAHRRFEIDFGSIDLVKVSSKTFRLGDLPADTFVLGLKVTSKSLVETPVWEHHSLNPTVRLTLIDERGQTIVQSQKPLKEWTWSGRVDQPAQSFVYRRDHDFRSSRGVAYQLLVEVVVPDLTASKYEVHLYAVGGGWK